eukprot:Pgem_evm1s8154
MQAAPTLPEQLHFTVDVKPSVRKTLATLSFTLEKKRLNWEMLLAEIHTVINNEKMDLEFDLTTDVIARILKFFSSSRTNIANTTPLTRENMLPSFE